MKVIIVGAGVAGLTCAKLLTAAGINVTILEKSDGIGGRVRSDFFEGFTLDRGFQVLSTAYPAARRQLDYAALSLRAFEPGALIAQGDRRHTLSDPARDPDALLSSLLTGIVSPKDKFLTWRLSGELGAKPDSAILDGPDETTEHFLRRRGFSERFLDHFARPFFGGIFLSRELQTSARCFQFNWKMLTEGATVIPAGGMGQIAEQLAVGLNIERNTEVQSLKALSAPNTVIVVATPAPEAARLTGLATPTGALGTVTLYFSGDLPLWPGKKILLNANKNPFVNNAGKHLLSATVLGVPENLSDSEIFAAALSDLTRMFTGDTAAQTILSTYKPLTLYKIPYAQFAQPKNFFKALPTQVTALPGVYFAAEFTGASSLNAAIRSGEKAAAAILSRFD
jgi:protoporphyrinogen oxidase